MVQLLLVDTEVVNCTREKKTDDFSIQITIILTLHLKYLKYKVKIKCLTQNTYQNI